MEHEYWNYMIQHVVNNFSKRIKAYTLHLLGQVDYLFFFFNKMRPSALWIIHARSLFGVCNNICNIVLLKYYVLPCR